MIRLKHAGTLAGVLLSFLLAACSHTLQGGRLHQAPPSDLPSRVELAETPFFAQQRYQCGPAALAMMLVDRGVGVHPDELVGKVFLPQRQGSVTIEMEAAARSYGMLVYPLAQRLEALMREIAVGNPVLVLQNLAFDWWPQWHYAVVIGYDLNEGTITLRSGVTRRYVVSMRTFENTWRRAGYWARVVVPPDTIPASADPRHFLEATVALEQSGHEAAALSGFRAATERWPDSGLSWLARGNLAYRLEQDNEAEAAFRQGLKSEPSNAALWNNLAYVFARRHCSSQALAAVHCAIMLSPEGAQYRDSLRELAAIAQGRDDCTVPVCPAGTAAQ